MFTSDPQELCKSAAGGSPLGQVSRTCPDKHREGATKLSNNPDKYSERKVKGKSKTEFNIKQTSKGPYSCFEEELHIRLVFPYCLPTSLSFDKVLTGQFTSLLFIKCKFLSPINYYILDV